MDRSSYDKSYESYMDYVNKCRNMIKAAFFTEKDAENIKYVDNGLGICDIVRNHRLKMIDIKIEHTMRMIEQVIKVNEQLGLKINLNLVVKTAVLYHDIGRMRQATWSNIYGDYVYKKNNMPYMNHAEDGYDIFINNKFSVDDKYVPIIAKTILNHQDYHTKEKLNYRFESDLRNIDIDKIVTGKLQLNDAEWQIVSLIVQLVGDLDKTDILYQHLSDDFEMIRDFVYDYSRDTIDAVSKKWGISKNEIIKYNNIDESIFEPQILKIPIKNLEISKLEVPQYMKEWFYNNSWPELPVLVRDDNWNFITMLWWRISHFLNQISFTSVLLNIEESKLLEQIYEKVPNKLKPLVYDAFEYGKEQLVSYRLEENKGRIYLK